MRIDLPTSPAPASATPGLMDFGSTLTPPLGGEELRIDRLGNRWRLSVTLPPLRGARARMEWASRLVRGKSAGVRMEFPQPGFDPGAPGAPVIDGAGQTGRTLSLRGVTPNYVWREGQYFSIETGGQHFLTMVDVETLTGSDGKVDLPISPMIRALHADGDVVHAGVPMIEGSLGGDDLAYQLDVGDFTSLAFEIRETR